MANGFEYRGFMLDVSRHYMPMRDIKKLIDAAQICGMNRMHWHLTDDQGWRIEIKKYPRLTGIGSHRGQSYFGVFSDTENNDGFYTQKEIREIVAYAKEHGIEIIPEIEMPGHASAMLAAYPQFGCRRVVHGRTDSRIKDNPYNYQVEVSVGIYPDLICGGKDESIRFFEDILDEVMTLFPYPVIHIGGDEAIKLHWRRCPDCQARMEKLGIQTEEELQRWMVLEVGEYLASKGRKTMVWCDVLAGGPLPDHFIVQQWMGASEATRAHLASGGKIIISDTAGYYLDYPFGRIDVHDIWQYPRIPAYAEGYESGVLGLECPLWTEYVTDLKRASFQLFPRMAAVALKASEPESMDWPAFRGLIAAKQKEIEALGLTGAPESLWELTPEQKKENLADWERLTRTPSIMPYIHFENRLMLLEHTERFMEEIGIPKAFAERAGDRIMASLYHGHIVTEDDGAGEMVHQLMEAVRNRRDGVWTMFPENVWLDTMKCFTRFVQEHRQCYGYDGYDRGFWTPRQVQAKLFRLGELEYEMLPDKEGNPRIFLHIPSDANLMPDPLNESVRLAREFFASYFPEYADAPMFCETWLLSPKLHELLPETAKIFHFQSGFELYGTHPDSKAAILWVFHKTAIQQKTLDLNELDESTTLQRSMKALLLSGGAPGSADGQLVRPFS
ncbi:MAG: family 20 glycosylhydrolase [Clostridia bacterium]|nr:family 20 glycosylhydrolase [Clostridia bacterium]